MRISLVSWRIFNLYIATFFSMAALSVSGQCQSHQQQLLLGFKNSLNSSLSEKLVKWNQGTDCCSWDGITCDTSGRVIGLDLSYQALSGELNNSNSLFRLQHLQTLNLAYNRDLGGQLPESIGNLGQLTWIVLWYCKFTGPIPKTLEKLTQLIYLDFSTNSFSGPIPKSKTLEKLTHLMHLDFSYNTFSGPLPSFTSLTNLTELILHGNQLNGSILSTNWSSLPNLVSLDLGRNSFTGTVPPALFQSESLKAMHLAENQFSGGFGEVKGEVSSQLEVIDMNQNGLEGQFPMFVFEIKGLRSLSLSWNKFSGVIPLSAFQKLKNLTTLDLSYNNLSVDSSFTNLPFPNVYELNLASCNLTKFPEFLENISFLQHLDLSNNRIHGQIPGWIWKPRLDHLNLSLNFLVELESPSHINPYMSVLDLHGNQFQGKIPSEIVDFLNSCDFISLAGNNFHGSIPESLCNNLHLAVLDLSNNSLSGSIPQCLLTQMSMWLGVLNLNQNNLSGIISDSFPENCSLQTLDLNQNRLSGKVPKYLANCRMLEVLDLGNNQIDDTFPCHLKSTSELRVLVLRSNKFRGGVNCGGNNVIWPMLQIVDLASNAFSGKLPQGLLMTWNSMKANKVEPYSKNLRYESPLFTGIYFQDSVSVTMKGRELELVKILTIFTSIDLSSNKFEGHIPEAIGDFKALYLLNLSNNVLTGPLPSFLGNLPKLEALDLSNNHLAGQIPLQLANLNFLSFLNLSNNELTGRIPLGTQIQLFSETSFENNAGLCGPPLEVQCDSPPTFKDGPSNSRTGKHVNWNFVSVEIGFVCGIGAVILPLMFCKRWRIRYYKCTDGVVYKFFPKLDPRNKTRRAISHWTPGRRL
ncbi:hypothetical protein V6N13_005868 [Hibiscus sabdariffa]|uniref:Leucine-rich repeat-containing N-terminal plant-type domain-containing protein n=1 Tax=Hibiscus sabdariffa TaxID=183260 RepID=A0ABR2ETE7_9ROSI